MESVGCRCRRRQMSRSGSDAGNLQNRRTWREHGKVASSLSDLRFRKPPDFIMRNERAGFSRLCGLLDGFLLVFSSKSGLAHR